MTGLKFLSKMSVKLRPAANKETQLWFSSTDKSFAVIKLFSAGTSPETQTWVNFSLLLTRLEVEGVFQKVFRQ